MKDGKIHSRIFINEAGIGFNNAETFIFLVLETIGHSSRTLAIQQ